MPDAVAESVTVAEAAKIAGVNLGTVYRWINHGAKSSGYGPGGRVRLPTIPSKLRRWRRVGTAELAAYLRDVVEAGREARGVSGGALAVERFGGGKLGDVSATYAGAATCPDSCRFKGAGCYADYDQTAMTWRRVSRGAAGMTPAEVARSEARSISTLTGVRPLRIHVAGDCRTADAAAVVAEAAAAYSARHGKPAWTYTHAWRDVPRAAWGGVSVLASCETPAEVRSAWAVGYAAAVTVAAFERPQMYRLGGVKVVPCPAMTKDGVTCSSCKLCFSDARLRRSETAIGFALHGSGRGKAAAALGRIPLPTA